MRFDFLISATLATLAAGSALPKEVMERQSGTGTVSCLSATTGPLVDQIRRGVGNIVLKANAEGKVCQPRVGSCDRISDYGTAGFRICSIVQAGLPPACWDPYWLSRKFLEIATTCPETDPGSIWSRVNGEYSVAVGELPNGTLWASLQYETITG